MIYEALLVPHERPITLREVKRALLTYDKVVLVDPSDRDIMPRVAFANAVLGMPMAIDMGPVCEMAKVNGYDDGFSQVADECKLAVQKGIVEIKPTYQIEGLGQITIGSIPTGGYPLMPNVVFSIYRHMAQDQAFLKSALGRLQNSALVSLLEDPEIFVQGRVDDSVNGGPTSPQIELEGISQEQLITLTRIARSRVGAFIKYAGYCEAKNLVPVFPSDVYGKLTQQLLNNTRETLAAAGVEDQFWIQRNKVLQLCHEEYLVDAILDDISVAEVLKLRTTVWGAQAQAREDLFRAVFRLASDESEAAKFEASAKKNIEEYRKRAEALVRERDKLDLEIKCELAGASLAGGAGVITSISQLESPVSGIGLTLIAGGVWVFDKLKRYVPQFRELRAKEQEMQRGAGFGLHGFYSRLANK